MDDHEDGIVIPFHNGEYTDIAADDNLESMDDLKVESVECAPDIEVDDQEPSADEDKIEALAMEKLEEIKKRRNGIQQINLDDISDQDDTPEIVNFDEYQDSPIRTVKVTNPSLIKLSNNAMFENISSNNQEAIGEDEFTTEDNIADLNNKIEGYEAETDEKDNNYIQDAKKDESGTKCEPEIAKCASTLSPTPPAPIRLVSMSCLVPSTSPQATTSTSPTQSWTITEVPPWSLPSPMYPRALHLQPLL